MDKSTLERLFERAVANIVGPSLQGKLTQGKLYELFVLIDVLSRLRAAGYKIEAKNAGGAHGSVLRLPGAPAVPDKAKYTYFEAFDSNCDKAYEVWVSLEVTTLSNESWSGPPVKCSYHEVDVGVYEGSLTSGVRPSFRKLVLACSCKFRPATKEQVREALGLRRETGLLIDPQPSAAPWFVVDVPAEPAIPVALYSKDPGAFSLSVPVDLLGLYVVTLPMP